MASVECILLITYLQNLSELEAVAVVFEANLALFFQAEEYWTELLHQSFARLLYHHATHTKVVKLAEVRKYLEGSVSAYPQNTIFLSLYAWNESKLRIDDRLHSRVNRVVDQSLMRSQTSIVPYSFMIDVEIARSLHSATSNNAIRSAFERALASEAGAHCAPLWKDFFLFRLAEGDVLGAEKVLYRALHACPWSKELPLLAFERLCEQDGMGKDKLERLFALMEDRGLRLYHHFNA